MKPILVKYKEFPDADGRPIFSAMLNVQIALPGPQAPRTKRFEVIIDSGASRCTFHTDFADSLGIDWRKCPIEKTMGIGGEELTYLHDIMLYIPGGPVMVKAAFKENLPVAGLLGMNGFFEHFKITFDGVRQCFTLERLHKAQKTN